MRFSHAAIIPLIGGIVLGQSKAFRGPPEYLLSYSPFKDNDKHLLNYYKDENIPYEVLDQGGSIPSSVAVMTTCCPCAGLSMLGHGYGDDNENNKWLIETSELVLGKIKPKVFWGENSIHFGGKIGDTVRNQMRQIGLDNGYSMSVYKTKSLLHGIPQVRERSFYFFWKGDKTPVLNYYNRPYKNIEDVITGVKTDFQMTPISRKTPSKDDVYYRFILQELHGGMSHRDFMKTLHPDSVRNIDVLAYLETKTDYNHVARWLKNEGFFEEAEKCLERQKKLDSGGEIMRRHTLLPRGYIGAFVGLYPKRLAHPVEDRYITYREAMSIMDMPEDFELVGANPSTANHICQSVPVGTAYDMASEVHAVLMGQREWIDTRYILQNNPTRSAEYDTDHSLENFFS